LQSSSRSPQAARLTNTSPLDAVNEAMDDLYGSRRGAERFWSVTASLDRGRQPAETPLVST